MFPLLDLALAVDGAPQATDYTTDLSRLINQLAESRLREIAKVVYCVEM